MSDICDYDADIDDDEVDEVDEVDEYEWYHKEEFVRWYYGKPQLDEFDMLLEYY